MKKSELVKIIKECINENQMENKEVDILKKLAKLLNKIDFSNTTGKGHEIAMEMERLLNTLLDLKGVSHVFTEIKKKSMKESHHDQKGKYLAVSQHHTMSNGKKITDGTKLSDAMTGRFTPTRTKDTDPSFGEEIWEILPNETLKFIKSNWDSSD
jgi:TPP-dependent 2-oxoacid decarboxylase